MIWRTLQITSCDLPRLQPTSGRAAIPPLPAHDHVPPSRKACNHHAQQATGPSPSPVFSLLSSTVLRSHHRRGSFLERLSTTRGTTSQHGWATERTPMERTTTAPTPHTEPLVSPDGLLRRSLTGTIRGTGRRGCRATVPRLCRPLPRTLRRGWRRPVQSGGVRRRRRSRGNGDSSPRDSGGRTRGAALPSGAAKADERDARGVRYVTDAPAPGKRSRYVRLGVATTR